MLPDQGGSEPELGSGLESPEVPVFLLRPVSVHSEPELESGASPWPGVVEVESVTGGVRKLECK